MYSEKDTFRKKKTLFIVVVRTGEMLNVFLLEIQLKPCANKYSLKMFKLCRRILVLKLLIMTVHFYFVAILFVLWKKAISENKSYFTDEEKLLFC